MELSPVAKPARWNAEWATCTDADEIQIFATCTNARRCVSCCQTVWIVWMVSINFENILEGVFRTVLTNKEKQILKKWFTNRNGTLLTYPSRLSLPWFCESLSAQNLHIEDFVCVLVCNMFLAVIWIMRRLWIRKHCNQKPRGVITENE